MDEDVKIRPHWSDEDDEDNSYDEDDIYNE